MDDRLKRRFWAKVAKSGPVPEHCPELGPCGVWTAGAGGFGHGQFWFRTRMWKAHRIAWLIAEGRIPDGMSVLHRCDNPPCVRRSHLFTGTQGDNNADRDRKGRQIAHPGEANGRAKLVEAQVISIRDRYAAGGVTQYQLADEMGVHQAVISGIVLRKFWSHIA